MTPRCNRVCIGLVLLLATAILSGCNAGLEPVRPESIATGEYSYAGELATHRIEALMKQHHIPGAAAALIVDQEIVWHESFGLANVESDTPVAEDTIFKLWSLAKPVTAMEIMRLAEAGLVDLDAPLDEYVPDFTIHSRFPVSEPISLRHILTHRSGLPRNPCLQPDWHFGVDALERAAASLEECFLAYPTGQRYKYSNVAYDLLGYVIQDKREQPFPVYMHDWFLEPIGMGNSSFWSSGLFGVGQLDPARVATGYEYFEGQYYPYEQYDNALIPSGNLHATIGDLASFVGFIFRNGEIGGEQFINGETLEAMFIDQYSRAEDPQPMGLGWKIGPLIGSEAVIWHDGGAFEGTGSLVAMLTEKKMGVILLANSTAFEGATTMPLALELLQTMVQAEGGAPPVEVPVESEVSLDSATLERYEGSYAIMGQIMDIELHDDRLKGSMAGLSFDLVPIAQDRFRLDHWLVRLGLAEFLRLPMDISDMEILFHPGTERAVDTAIINFGNISYEYGPRYPDLADIPQLWQSMAREYERYDRLASGQIGQEKRGEVVITIDDGHLSMSGVIGPILPLDDRTTLILSSPYAGETIERDPQTGILRHQGNVYQPKTSGE